MRFQYQEKETDQGAGYIHAVDLALACGEQPDDKSLLQVILARQVNEFDAGKIAENLIGKFEHLGNVIHADLQALMSVEGLTLPAAATILKVRHLLKAVSRAEVRNCVLLDSEAKIHAYCKSLVGRAKREEFHALFLNKRGEMLGEECLQRGTLDHVSVYPREVLKQAVRYDAGYVILLHNHPAGKAYPSRADIEMTRHLSGLLGAVGARVFDHIIVSVNETFSFRQQVLADCGVSAHFARPTFD